MAETISAIDVGTTKICTVVGEADRSGVRVLGIGVAPARGLRKGGVVDVHEAAQAVAQSVEEAERTTAMPVTRAYVGIAGRHISSINSRGSISLGGKVVSTEDVNRAMEAARTIAVPHDREILHCIPRGYVLDGQDGVSDPLDMSGHRLEVETHIITAAQASIANLVRAVEEAKVQVVDLVLEPLAAAEAVLTPAERQMGVLLADIGGGTTDVAIFHEGSVAYTQVLEVAGNHLTNDLAIGLRCPFVAAEEVKIRYGSALASHVSENEMVEVGGFGEEARQSVPRRFVAEILEARVEEILSLVLRELQRAGYDGYLAAGAVLTGGTAELGGLRELARRMLRLPVRIGYPMGTEGLVGPVRSTAYATSVGLVHWGSQPGRATRPAGAARRRPALNRRFGGWLRHVFMG